MGNKRYQRMAPYRRKEGAMNGKQTLPEDGAPQRERVRYKSAHTVIAKRPARGWLDCWHATSTTVTRSCNPGGSQNFKNSLLPVEKIKMKERMYTIHKRP